MPKKSHEQQSVSERTFLLCTVVVHDHTTQSHRHTNSFLVHDDDDI